MHPCTKLSLTIYPPVDSNSTFLQWSLNWERTSNIQQFQKGENANHIYLSHISSPVWMFANQLPYQHYIDCVTFIIFRWVTESMVSGFTQPVNKYQPSAKNNSELYFPVYIILCSAINASKHMTRYGSHSLTLHFAIIGNHNRNCCTPMFTMIISVNVLSSVY